MITFILPLLICLISAMLGLIFTFVINKSSKRKVLPQIFSFIVTFFSFFLITIPTPQIYPLNNETKTFIEDTKITISSNLGFLSKTYYTLDGTDPIYGVKYVNPIIISDSTTICARTRLFDYFWSDITEKAYIFDGSVKDRELKLSEERPSYTLQEINQGVLGDKITFNSIDVIQSDHDWYKQCHDGQDIPKDAILNEFNFVGISKNNLPYPSNYIEGNEIIIEDGGTYTINMYVNNNNSSKVAEDTKVWFDIPTKSDKQLQIYGYVESSNASPSIYGDYITLNSKMPFHIEYQYGSATLENNGIGHYDYFTYDYGVKLSDNIIQSTAAFQGREDGGTLIGYDKLDGKIPGGYDHITNISITVKTYFDYNFIVKTGVRNIYGESQDWTDSVGAKVGDTIEFLILYKNIGFDQYQTNVMVQNLLDDNLQYIPGSATIHGKNYEKYSPDGCQINFDELTTTGINIGNFYNGEKVLIVFKAKVVDKNLKDEYYYAINRSTISVGQKDIQNIARVCVNN